jgi:23S rRNA (pseudouridine1915-N3)-methyltransferase
MRAEAERLEARLSAGVERVVLDRAARAWSSRQLAEYLDERAVHALGDVAFVIGGAWGLDRQFVARAQRTMSLGALTLPHELARLVFTEQLYRAGTILRNEPYHKGRD